MPHTVPGPAPVPAVAPLQSVSALRPCPDSPPQPQRHPLVERLVDGPRNAPATVRGPSGSSLSARPDTKNSMLFASINNASGSRPTAPAAPHGQAQALSPPFCADRLARAPDRNSVSTTLQRLIDMTVDARLTDRGEQAAYADCARALGKAWGVFCDNLVAKASADIPRWFSHISESAPAVTKAELTRIAGGPLEDILATECFNDHLKSPELMAPLRAPIMLWLALHVAELQREDAAHGVVDARDGENYLRHMDAVLASSLTEVLGNSTLRCLISALAARSRSD